MTIITTNITTTTMIITIITTIRTMTMAAPAPARAVLPSASILRCRS